jgi:iron complex outermembrane receptor protein
MAAIFRHRCTARARLDMMRMLLLGASAIAAAPALAQAADASAGAPQQAAPAPNVDGGEVIVTAQKRAQNLQQVSAAVTAVSSDRLAAAHVDNLEGLQVVVPNVSFGNDFNVAKIFIRGIGMNVSTNGTDPAVAVYVDGAVISRPEAQFASLFDLERVEVLRGPQGTLFGRNAVGGAINLITAKPTHELSGYARFTAGNYDSFTGEGALSGPLADGIYARGAVRVDTRGGYGKNEFTGNDIDDLNRKMGRLELQFDKGGPFSALISGEYFNENDNANAVKYGSATFPGIASLFPVGQGGFATKPRDLASEIDPVNKLKTWSVTSTLDYKAAEWLTLRSVSNYRKVNQQLIQDLDVSSVVNSLATNGQAPTIQNRNPFSRQWSEELQGIIKTSRLEGVLGAFYFHENLGSLPNTQGVAPNGVGEPLDIPALTAAGIPITTPIPARFAFFNDLETSRAWALFGDLTYHLTDTIALKAGGRYSHERRTLDNHGYVIANNGKGPVVRTDFFDANTFGNFSPKAGIEYHPNNDLMLYYTFSRGFKSGTGEISLSKNPITDPETISAHEVGLKSQLFDRRLTFNVAAFYNRLHGLQLERTVFNQLLSFTTVFENATETEAYGVELDTSWRIAPGLRLDFSGTYLHSVFRNYFASNPNDARNVAGSPVFAPFLSDLDGNATRYSPKWTFDIHPQYDWRIGNGGMITFAGDVSYKSKQYHTEFNDDAMSQPAYVFANSNIRYTAPGGHVTLDLFVQNMFNKLERAGSFSLSSSREIGVTYLPPRTFGGTVGYRF